VSGPVHKRDVLTDVAARVTMTSPRGGPLNAPLRPVTRYTARAVSTQDAPQALVYEAFRRKLKEDAREPRLGAVAASD
jgi:hypothetical protein